MIHSKWSSWISVKQFSLGKLGDCPLPAATTPNQHGRKTDQRGRRIVGENGVPYDRPRSWGACKGEERRAAGAQEGLESTRAHRWPGEKLPALHTRHHHCACTNASRTAVFLFVVVLRRGPSFPLPYSSLHACEGWCGGASVIAMGWAGRCTLGTQSPAFAQ